MPNPTSHSGAGTLIEPSGPRTEVSGILNVDKPQGVSSHDVVAAVRRIAGQHRVGHAGTLDPLATGVLLVCLGKATRLTEYLAEGTKVYLATIRFGATTDTYDADGAVLATADARGLTLEILQAALMDFRGEVSQVPPMYSALKSRGQPLYRLARRGITVERVPRVVRVDSLTVIGWQSPDLTVRVVCSKGTYVRCLAHDLGQTVGVGAHLLALSREAVGHFVLADAVPMAALEIDATDGRWRRFLVPMTAALQGMACVSVGGEQKKRIRCGEAVSLDEQLCVAEACALDECGDLLAILRRDSTGGLWRPHKVFSS